MAAGITYRAPCYTLEEGEGVGHYMDVGYVFPHPGRGEYVRSGVVATALLVGGLVQTLYFPVALSVGWWRGELQRDMWLLELLVGPARVYTSGVCLVDSIGGVVSPALLTRWRGHPPGNLFPPLDVAPRLLPPRRR